jgi:hypothetical protein
MTPVVVSGSLSGLSAKQVKAGFDFTCWMVGEADNELLNMAFCAGAGVDGQLGNGSTANSSVPVAVNTSNIANETTYIRLSSTASTIEIDLGPTPSDAIGAGSITLNVVTNSENGYNLQIKSDSTNLVCATNSSATIASQSTDGEALATDRWGYGTGPTEPTTWDGVTTSDVSIDNFTSSTDANGHNTTLWVGAKVSFATPACAKYQGTIYLTAVTIP